MRTVILIKLKELSLSPNLRRPAEVLQMPLSTFEALCQWFKKENLLSASKKISVEEQVAMFLAIVGHGNSNRQVQERFQHSGETVFRYFHKVLRASLELYSKTVRLPPAATPQAIEKNLNFFPYFKNCLGALDGSHIVAFIPEEDAVRFRNRKRFLSQNIMAACTFDLQF